MSGIGKTGNEHALEPRGREVGDVRPVMEPHAFKGRLSGLVQAGLPREPMWKKGPRPRSGRHNRAAQWMWRAEYRN